MFNNTENVSHSCLGNSLLLGRGLGSEQQCNGEIQVVQLVTPNGGRVCLSWSRQHGVWAYSENSRQAFTRIRPELMLTRELQQIKTKEQFRKFLENAYPVITHDGNGDHILRIFHRLPGGTLGYQEQLSIIRDYLGRLKLTNPPLLLEILDQFNKIVCNHSFSPRMGLEPFFKRFFEAEKISGVESGITFIQFFDTAAKGVFDQRISEFGTHYELSHVTQFREEVEKEIGKIILDPFQDFLISRSGTEHPCTSSSSSSHPPYRSPLGQSDSSPSPWSSSCDYPSQSEDVSTGFYPYGSPLDLSVDSPYIIQKLIELGNSSGFTSEMEIDILSLLIRKGETVAESAQDKDLVIVLGYPGAGKSTFLNAICDCTMSRRIDDEYRETVVVVPTTEGGCCDEVMPIGHELESKTFWPQVVLHDGMALCDLPGWASTDARVIRIANGANIANAFKRARSVRIVILLRCSNLTDDRGIAFQNLLGYCNALFGSAEALEKNHASIFFGLSLRSDDSQQKRKAAQSILTKALCRHYKLESARLSQKIFQFDPAHPIAIDNDATSLATVKRLINCLTPIEDPKSVFHAPLSSTELYDLNQIVNQTRDRIRDILKQPAPDLRKVAEYLSTLRRLSIISDRHISSLIEETEGVIIAYFLRMKEKFYECHMAEKLTASLNILKAMIDQAELFDDRIQSHLGMTVLRETYHSLSRYDREAFFTEYKRLETLFFVQLRSNETAGADATLSSIRKMSSGLFYTKDKISFGEIISKLEGFLHDVKNPPLQLSPMAYHSQQQPTGPSWTEMLFNSFFGGLTRGITEFGGGLGQGAGIEAGRDGYRRLFGNRQRSSETRRDDFLRTTNLSQPSPPIIDLSAIRRQNEILASALRDPLLPPRRPSTSSEGGDGKSTFD